MTILFCCASVLTYRRPHTWNNKPYFSSCAYSCLTSAPTHSVPACLWMASCHLLLNPIPASHLVIRKTKEHHGGKLHAQSCSYSSCFAWAFWKNWNPVLLDILLSWASWDTSLLQLLCLWVTGGMELEDKVKMVIHIVHETWGDKK